MTQSLGVPLLPGVGPPERMVRIALLFPLPVSAVSCVDGFSDQGLYLCDRECREGGNLWWTGKVGV